MFGIWPRYKYPELRMVLFNLEKMKMISQIFLCVFLFIACKGKPDNKGETRKSDKISKVSCKEGFDFASAIKAIISEEKEGAKLFKALHNAGLDSIKVASNFDFKSRKITFQNRLAYFIPDTNIRMPMIILAVQENCNFAKFEFGYTNYASKGYSLNGSLERKDSTWKVNITDVIEIN